MLKRYHHALLCLIIVLDLIVTAASWLLAYFVRFELEIPALTKGPQPFKPYLLALPVVLLVAWFSYRGSHLYVPRREGHFRREVMHIFRSCALMLVVLMALMFLTKPVPDDPGMIWSRPVAALFVAINGALMTIERASVRAMLRHLRRRGWNLRHVLIVGAGRLGQRLLERIERNPWTGLHVIGFADPEPVRVGKEVHGFPVLGTTDDLPGIIARHGIDQVFVALPFTKLGSLVQILDAAGAALAEVRIFPDLQSFVTLNPSVEEFDGLPVLSLHDTPLQGWNVVWKRLMDIVLSSLLLVVAGPIILVFGLIHKRLSPGPMFFKQRRVGLDGREFDIIKIRSMQPDAEAKTGPVWASKDDSRRTGLGAFMRNWNIDELPQLWNVLRGDMSLVGPRPERPEFIGKFRERIPKYMLRHKMKAGMTGWAQVNGWRGDTSLDKRIQYDLYYIENWSLFLDLWILLLTPFARKNAY